MLSILYGNVFELESRTSLLMFIGTYDLVAKYCVVKNVTISRDLEISCEFVHISSSREPHFGDLNFVNRGPSSRRAQCCFPD